MDWSNQRFYGHLAFVVSGSTAMFDRQVLPA